MAEKNLNDQNMDLQKQLELLQIKNDVLKEKLQKAKANDEKHKRHKLAFMTNLSHEIRTPLNGILGFSEIVSQNNLSYDERLSYLNIIGESGNLLVSVIADILDISKIEMGQMKIHIEKFNLNSMLEQIYRVYKDEIESKKLQLFFENLLNDEFLIKTDKEKLNKILSRLIDSSIKYTKSGWIKVRYQLEEKNLAFIIEHTGMEVPEELKPTFFDRFNHEVMTSSMNFGGTGLGLSLCNGLVNCLGGKLWLENKTSSTGSVYKFTIPVMLY